jgi:tetratricopeptide (TPR) repeat protein
MRNACLRNQIVAATGIAAALCLGVVAPGSAQVIRVSGTVKDPAGHGVRGAVVTADNPDQTPAHFSATSNAKGQFGFLGIKRGTWLFTIDAPGYEIVRVRRPIAAGRQEPLELRLTAVATPVSLPMEGTTAADLQQRIERAEGMAASGNLDGAIGAWQEIVKIAPALTMVYMRIGALYERKPDPDRAIAAYRRLLEIEPGNANARAAVDRLANHRQH